VSVLGALAMTAVHGFPFCFSSNNDSRGRVNGFELPLGFGAYGPPPPLEAFYLPPSYLQPYDGGGYPWYGGEAYPPDGLPAYSPVTEPQPYPFPYAIPVSQQHIFGAPQPTGVVQPTVRPDY
jgi:hypothetical protein